MRFNFTNLLNVLILTRVFVLFLPWLTLTLLFPDGNHLNWYQFTEISWNRWDAPHYIYVAENWYTNVGDEANFIVFFPLYPLILKAVYFIVGSSVTISIITSILLFLAGCYFFYKLIGLDYGNKIATSATILLSIFPTSYFFNAPYTESLFLLTLSAGFYYARKGNWVVAGIIAGLGTLSRPFGFLMLPAILIEWFVSEKKHMKHLPIIILPTVIAGLSYLYLNWQVYGDYFQFQKTLASNWHKTFVLPYMAIADSWRIALGGGLTNYAIFVGWAEAITISLSWILIPFVIKKLRLSWAFFYVASTVFFSSTSFILSTPRYILSVPFVFVLLAMAEKDKSFKLIWRFLSIGLLISLSIIFAHGQWAF